MPPSIAPSPPALAALDYWRSLPAVGGVPDRADLDPLAIRTLLPDLYLLDVIDQGAQFRIRLIGTRLVDRLGRDATGRLVDEVTDGRHRQRVLSLFRRAAETRTPVYAAGRYERPPLDYSGVERMILPFTRGAGEVAILMVLQTFPERTTRSAPDLSAMIHAEPGGTIRYELFET